MSFFGRFRPPAQMFALRCSGFLQLPLCPHPRLFYAKLVLQISHLGHVLQVSQPSLHCCLKLFGILFYGYPSSSFFCLQIEIQLQPQPQLDLKFAPVQDEFQPQLQHIACALAALGPHLVFAAPAARTLHFPCLFSMFYCVRQAIQATMHCFLHHKLVVQHKLCVRNPTIFYAQLALTGPSSTSTSSYTNYLLPK